MDDLSVQITGADGSTVSFSTTATNTDDLMIVDKVTTKRGTGHESAQLTLARDPLKRYDDLDLLYNVSITAPDGFELFAGRISGINPESGKLQINCTGNWSIAKDLSNISEVYTDVSMERWGGVPLERRAAILASGYASEEASTGNGQVVTKLAQPAWTTGALPNSEAWYTPPVGANIGSITATWTRTTGVSSGGDANHSWAMLLASDTTPSSYDTSGDLQAAGPGTATLTATTTRSFGVVQFAYSAAFGTSDSFDRSIAWSAIQVQGDHGLTSITPSEVVKHLVGKYCPGLTYDADSITEHPYEIPHLVLESTEVAEGWARANAFANWSVDVWGNKVYYAPDPLLTEPDFILDIKRGDVLDPDGQSIDENWPCNGVEVNYTDSLTGRKESIGPADDYRLTTTDPENPCVAMGVNRYGKLDIGFPCAEDDAIQIGSVWLAEALLPGRVGSGSVTGKVLTASGDEVPAHHIRSGDVVRYAHESTGRLVYGTIYDPVTGKNELRFDPAPATLTAMLERIGVAVMKVGGR